MLGKEAYTDDNCETAIVAECPTFLRIAEGNDSWKSYSCWRSDFENSENEIDVDIVCNWKVEYMPWLRPWVIYRSNISMKNEYICYRDYK